MQAYEIKCERSFWRLLLPFVFYPTGFRKLFSDCIYVFHSSESNVDKVHGFLECVLQSRASVKRQPRRQLERSCLLKGSISWIVPWLCSGSERQHRVSACRAVLRVSRRRGRSGLSRRACWLSLLCVLTLSRCSPGETNSCCSCCLLSAQPYACCKSRSGKDKGNKNGVVTTALPACVGGRGSCTAVTLRCPWGRAGKVSRLSFPSCEVWPPKRWTSLFQRSAWKPFAFNGGGFSSLFCRNAWPRALLKASLL